MSEALNKVVDYGFNEMGLKCLEVFTNIINNKSVALLEKNNFTRVTSFIEKETYSGEPMELVIYKREVK